MERKDSEQKPVDLNDMSLEEAMGQQVYALHEVFIEFNTRLQNEKMVPGDLRKPVVDELLKTTQSTMDFLHRVDISTERLKALIYFFDGIAKSAVLCEELCVAGEDEEDEDGE